MIDASVVIETVNIRADRPSTQPLADAVAPVVTAVQNQTLPRARYEILLVLDRGVSDADVAEVQHRYSDVRVVFAELNYFAQKNSGAAAARAPLVMFMDSDCVPDRGWLEAHLEAFAAGADVVTGRTRYGSNTVAARALAVTDFGSIFDEQGTASGILLNNAAFRRDIALRFPLDERIRRNGGCDALHRSLLAARLRVVYERRAKNTHFYDGIGAGHLRKHFNRGYDSIGVYRRDDSAVLRGTRLFRRLGPIALAAITAVRFGIDCRRLVRYREEFDIPVAALPAYVLLMAVTRAIEWCGGMTAMVHERTR